MMTTEDTLWATEERFWTQGADSARTMTAKGAVFVFPYPVGILQGDRIWREDLVAQRWRSVEIFRAVRQPGKGHRRPGLSRLGKPGGGEPRYEAYCTSSYLNDKRHMAADLAPADARVRHRTCPDLTGHKARQLARRSGRGDRQASHLAPAKTPLCARPHTSAICRSARSRQTAHPKRDRDAS